MRLFVAVVAFLGPAVGLQHPQLPSSRTRALRRDLALFGWEDGNAETPPGGWTPGRADVGRADGYGRERWTPQPRGALARKAAREEAAFEAQRAAEAAAAEAEAAAKAKIEEEKERPKAARTPDEAVKRLQQMGARVVFPPKSGAESNPDTSWSALAGAGDLRHQVEEALVLPLQHPELFETVRAGTRSFSSDRSAALLFYGPPGTGKTTAARIAAAQAGLPLVYTPLEALMSKWYGKAEQQLALLFDHCGALGRCVLFLDELDALAGSRSREIDEASRRMLSVLLRRLDGMEAQPDVTLVAATNRRTDLDSALLSRFDVRVHFPTPEAPARASILALYARHLQPAELEALGRDAVGLSGRDLLDVCRQAENRWVSILIRGGDTFDGPLLPPFDEYDAALRRRLESSADKEDGAGAEAAAKAVQRRSGAKRRPGTPVGYSRPSPGGFTGGIGWSSGVTMPGWPDSSYPTMPRRLDGPEPPHTNLR